MSLRTKQALILLLATVLPFIIGAAAVNFVVAPAYRQAVARAAQAETRRVAEQLSSNIARDVARLEKLAAWADVRTLARTLTFTPSEAQQLESDWPQLSVDDARLNPILRNHVARELRWLRDTDPSIAEIGLTNEQGQIVAATDKVEDFEQSDEEWWQRTYAGDRGRVYISDVRYDPSAQTVALDVVVPVYADGAPGSEVIGVLKMVLNVAQVFSGVERTRVGEAGQALIVNGEGQVISFTSPPSQRELAAGPPPAVLQQQAVGSSYAGPGNDYLYAWAAIALEGAGDGPTWVMPDLFVVTVRPTEEVLGPLQRVQVLMLLIGFITISSAVLLGYWLADVLVVRQIQSLAAGMRELARGDFERAAAIADRLLETNGDRQREEDIPTTKEPTARP